MVETGPPPRGSGLPGPEPAYRQIVAGDLAGIMGPSAGAGSVEISGLRRVDSIKGPSWLTCVRSNVGAQSRSFAVYIQDQRIVDSRMAVLIDRCDEQAYEPLNR
jgi:hypothetical protein